MHEAASPMRAASPAVSWIAADRLHLTLKFLGEQSETDAKRIAAAVSGVVSPHRPFSVEMGGAGAFPNFRQPRVVWMGVSDDPKLELLHHAVESACAGLGHELEGRAFRAHVTLGRVRRAIDGAEARALGVAARAVRYRGTLEVSSVDLMRSRLGAGGSRYTLVSALPLEGGA